MIKFLHSFKNLILSVILLGSINAIQAQFITENSIFELLEEVYASHPDIPHNFSLQFDNNRIDQLNNRSKATEATNDLYYFPTTVVLNAIIDNPKQYTYSYNTAGNRLTTNIKKYNNEIWVNISFELCTYDNFGNRLVSQWQEWQGSSYANSSKITWTYTTNRNVLTELKQVWTNNAWVNSERTTNTYDVIGNKVASLQETWINGSWTNNGYDLLTYNENNMLTGLTRQVWISGTWINSLQLTYSYDANDNMGSFIIQIWENNAWTNSYKEIYAYNTSNQLTQYFVQSWTAGVWTFDEKYTYTYNTLGFRTVSLGEMYVNNTWVNSRRAQYNHNNFGGIQSELIESWTSGAWLNVTLANNAYDENGNALICDLFHWNGSTWVQNQDGNVVMYYSNSIFSTTYPGYHTEASYTSILVGLDKQLKTNSGLTIIPNPAKDNITISFELKQQTTVELVLMDLNGNQLIKNNLGLLEKGTNQINLSVGEFTNGLYIIQLNTNSNKQNVKFLISK